MLYMFIQDVRSQDLCSQTPNSSNQQHKIVTFRGGCLSTPVQAPPLAPWLCPPLRLLWAELSPPFALPPFPRARKLGPTNSF